MSGKFPTWRLPEPEKDLVVKQKMLYFQIRSIIHTDVDESTLPIVDDKMKFFEESFNEFKEGIVVLLLFHSDSLGADRVRDWKNVWSSTIKDANEYRRNIHKKANLVKKSLVLSFPSHTESPVTTSMFQNEMRKHDDCPHLNMYAVTVLDLMERAQQGKENERQEKFNETVGR